MLRAVGVTATVEMSSVGAAQPKNSPNSKPDRHKFLTVSHARTVVPECCKGDDESQWERVKFDPPPPKNPLNRRSPKFAYLTTSGISTTRQNFIQIGLGVSVLRMRDFAPQSDSAIFWGVLEKGYSHDARTDFDAKYVKRRGSAQGSVFWGSRNQNLRLRPPFSPKTAIFGPHF